MASEFREMTKSLALTVTAAVLGMLQFGYSTGVMNAPGVFIQKFIQNSYDVSEDTARTLLGVAVSAFAVGGMLGCTIAPCLSERRGRKSALFINAILGLFGAVLMGAAEPSNSFELLLLGRFIIGVNCGFATAASPTYVSEVSPLRLRGALGTLNQLAVALGLVGGQVLGLDVVLGSAEGWPWLLVLAVVPSLFQCFLLPLVPESPRYLLIALKDEEGARAALTKLRGSSEIDAEIDDMHAEEHAEKRERKFTVRELVTTGSLRAPLIIGIVMHLSQQLGGINAVLYYSTIIFVDAGLSQSNARIATVGVGCSLLVMVLVSVPLMDRVGRRSLQLWGLGGMTVFSLLMTVAFFTYKSNTTMSAFAIIFTLMYVMFFGVGPSSIPWMIMSELFGQGTRSAAVAIGALVNWLANFIVGLTFLPLSGLLKDYMFLPYTVLLIFFFAFTYFKLPETKNRTIEEVTALFNK